MYCTMYIFVRQIDCIYRQVMKVHYYRANLVLKPKNFRSNVFHHQFYLPEVNIQVQNGHGVLRGLISCI
jgi:hypothetical protein